MADLEPGSIDISRGNSVCKLYNPDNFVFGMNGTGNNWAKGHYSEGEQFIDQILDAVRR